MVKAGTRNGGSPGGMLFVAENGRSSYDEQAAATAPAKSTVTALRAVKVNLHVT